MTTVDSRPIPPEVEDIRRRYDVIFREFDAGTLDRDEAQTRVAVLQDELKAFNASLPSPEGCPPWCTKHQLGWMLLPEDDSDRHVHQAQGENWYFQIEGPDQDGDCSFEPMEYRSMSLAEARQYALSVLRAVALVEAGEQAKDTPGCPPWCVDHTERATPDASGFASEWTLHRKNREVGDSGCSVNLMRLDDQAPHIWLGGGDVDLDANQAREVAAALMEAADTLER